MPTALELLRMTTVAARKPFLRAVAITPSTGPVINATGVLVEPKQLIGSIGDEAGFADTASSYFELYTPDGHSVSDFPVGSNSSYGSLVLQDTGTRYTIFMVQQEGQIIRLHLGHP